MTYRSDFRAITLFDLRGDAHIFSDQPRASARVLETVEAHLHDVRVAAAAAAVDDDVPPLEDTPLSADADAPAFNGYISRHGVEIDATMDALNLERSAMQKVFHRAMCKVCGVNLADDDMPPPPLEPVPPHATSTWVLGAGFTVRLLHEVDAFLQELGIAPSAMREEFRRAFCAVGLFLEVECAPRATIQLRKLDPTDKSLRTHGPQHSFTFDMSSFAMRRHVGGIWRHLCALLVVFDDVELQAAKVVYDLATDSLDYDYHSRLTLKFSGHNSLAPTQGWESFVGAEARLVERATAHDAAQSASKSAPAPTPDEVPAPPPGWWRGMKYAGNKYPGRLSSPLPRWRRVAKYLGHWLCCVPTK
jgi:hypothetical protein